MLSNIWHEDCYLRLRILTPGVWLLQCQSFFHKEIIQDSDNTSRDGVMVPHGPCLCFTWLLTAHTFHSVVYKVSYLFCLCSPSTILDSFLPSPLFWIQTPCGIIAMSVHVAAAWGFRRVLVLYLLPHPHILSLVYWEGISL